MKKIDNAKGDLVVKLARVMPWLDMAKVNVGHPDLVHSYYVDTPNITYVGYSADGSGATGCQDPTTFTTYYFPISDGDSPCTSDYNLLYPESGGFLINGISKTYTSSENGQIWIR